MQMTLARYVRRLGTAVVVALVTLSVAAPGQAQSVDPSLQGRVFQSSDGALWIYKDGVKYPLIGVDLSQDAIDAIPAVVDQPVESVDQLFASEAAPAAGVAAVAPSPSPPVLEIGNPHLLDKVPAGLDMQGTAYDPQAAQGSGIDRVQVFLEDREKGGTHLGDANLAGPISNGWQIVVTLPPGLHTLFVYARSAATGLEAVASIPVQVVT
jgi:hypothetical protein